jgi:hypothetical protein
MASVKFVGCLTAALRQVVGSLLFTGVEQKCPRHARFFRVCDGFRMPARHDGAARTRAGVRKPPGKEGAGCGAPGSAGAMGIWLAPSVQRRRHAAGSAAADEHRHPFPAQTGIKSALVQGVGRPLPYPRMVIGPTAVVAGLEPAARSVGSEEQDRADHHHDVSIRTAVVDAVGPLRGVEPASNISMMTIGEPQHGQ